MRTTYCHEQKNTKNAKQHIPCVSCSIWSVLPLCGCPTVVFQTFLCMPQNKHKKYGIPKVQSLYSKYLTFTTLIDRFTS